MFVSCCCDIWAVVAESFDIVEFGLKGKLAVDVTRFTCNNNNNNIAHTERSLNC